MIERRHFPLQTKATAPSKRAYLILLGEKAQQLRNKERVKQQRILRPGPPITQPTNVAYVINSLALSW